MLQKDASILAMTAMLLLVVCLWETLSQLPTILTSRYHRGCGTENVFGCSQDESKRLSMANHSTRDNWTCVVADYEAGADSWSKIQRRRQRSKGERDGDYFCVVQGWETRDSPYSVPGWKTDSPYSVPGWKTDSPYSVPGWKTDSPYSVPGWKTDSPYSVPGWKTNSPYSVPGWTTDSPYSVPGWKTDSPYVVPAPMPWPEPASPKRPW